MRGIMNGMCAACLIALSNASAAAAILASGTVGTAAPPAMLGTYLMTAFPNDTQPKVAIVSSVASPLGGLVAFTRSPEHFDIPIGWGTWSHGYTGDVYWTMTAHQITLTLPAGTKAFYFYAQPNPFGPHELIATAQDGTVLVQSPDGNGGARYYGFHATGSDTLQTIQIISPNPGGVDFAVGEFAIANAASPSADQDGDGDVDGIDLATVLGVWTGPATYAPCPPLHKADLNGDCRINGQDLAIVLGAWG